MDPDYIVICEVQNKIGKLCLVNKELDGEPKHIK